MRDRLLAVECKEYTLCLNSVKILIGNLKLICTFVICENY